MNELPRIESALKCQVACSFGEGFCFEREYEWTVNVAVYTKGWLIKREVPEVTVSSETLQTYQTWIDDKRALDKLGISYTSPDDFFWKNGEYGVSTYGVKKSASIRISVTDECSKRLYDTIPFKGFGLNERHCGHRGVDFEDRLVAEAEEFMLRLLKNHHDLLIKLLEQVMNDGDNIAISSVGLHHGNPEAAQGSRFKCNTYFSEFDMETLSEEYQVLGMAMGLSTVWYETHGICCRIDMWNGKAFLKPIEHREKTVQSEKHLRQW